MPGAIPETMPDVPTVATAVALLDHEPPGIVADMEAGEPIQIVTGPLMLPASGNGFTETVAVAMSVPQTLVTV